MDKIREFTFLTQSLLMCVQQSQTPFIQSIFLFLHINIIYTWMVKDFGC